MSDNARHEGEYYTPMAVVDTAVKYLTKELGAGWQDEYAVYDPASGTGNLLRLLKVPGRRVFASTLHEEDAKTIDWYPEATSFGLDFLSSTPEDLKIKMPSTLQAALKNDKVLFFMNPPYKSSTSDEAGHKSVGVGHTAIFDGMVEDGVAEAGRELVCQFLYQAHHVCPHAAIAIFAPTKYLAGVLSSAFTSWLFGRYTLRAGFLFPSTMFRGVKSEWAVSFAVWLPKTQGAENNHVFDVLFDGVNCIGQKVLRSPTKEDLLCNSFEKNKKSDDYIDTPLASTAISVYRKAPSPGKNPRLVRGSLGYAVLSAGVQQQTNTTILSIPAVGGNGAAITEEAFESTMVLVAVARSVKRTWLNNNDLFYTPRCGFPRKFVNECVLFNLFGFQNSTSEFTTKFRGEDFKIINHFFPFGSTFVSEWLREHIKSHRLLDMGRRYYDLFSANEHRVNKTRWKIMGTNPGYYQIRMSMNDVNIGKNEYKSLVAEMHKSGQVIEKTLPNLGILI